MSVRATGQVTLIDLTDGYSVIMTTESTTFLGTETAVSGTQTLTSTIQAMCGKDVVPCTVGAISAPTGLSIVSGGQTPSPTLTITATSALTKSGSVVIPVNIPQASGDPIVISKTFTWAIAFKGAQGESVTITSTSVQYQASSSGTETPTGTWLDSIPAVSQGQYLWTRTIVSYSDGKSTTSYSVSRQGQNGSAGTSITITKTEVAYQVSANGTTAPSGEWVTTTPTVPQGQYLWTRTTVTYSDGQSTVAYSVSRQGVDGSDGQDGADAISLVITSSNGNIFKNTEIATTLTAHVYKGGVEVSGGSLTALGTIKWYKDENFSSAVATGSTLTINPGDVSNVAVYTAQLEN